MGPGQPGRVGREGQPLDGPVVGRGQLGDLAGGDIDGQQPAVVEGGRDRSPVRGSGQAGDRAAKTFGKPNGAWFTGHGTDLERVGAGAGVGDPDHRAGLAQHPGQPGPGVRVHVQRPGRTVLVGQPVHRAAHLDHAGLPGLVAVQAAQVIARGDEPRGAGRGRGAEGDLHRVRPGGLGTVQHPDVARDVVDDAVPVGAGVPGVLAVVVGVPGQVGAVQGAGVDVPGALVVGQEEQPAADQHRAAELGVQVGQDPGEQGVVAGGDPELARGAAPVTLPVGRLAVLPAGQQRGPGGFEGQVADRAERQPPGRRAVQRDRVGPGVLVLRLPGGADGQHLPGLGPAGHPGPVVTPVGKAGLAGALGIGGEDLGLAVPPAGPGDRSPVPGETRVADLGGVGGQPPGAAPLGGCEPYVVFCDEDEKLTVNMRIPKITSGSHAVYLRGCR